MRTEWWARLITGLISTVVVCSQAGAADKMVLGTGVDPAFAAFYVGVEAGIFKKHGIDAEYKLFASGGASTPYLVSGDIQASMAGSVGGVVAHARTPKIVTVAQVGAVRDWFAGVADASVKDVPSLRGQKVGVSIGTHSEQVATESLNKFGMALKDISVVNVEPPEMLAALERRDIVAYFTWEPWITRAKLALGDRVHFLPGTTDTVSINDLYMDVDWIQKNQDLALRFLRAFRETNQYIKTNPKEAVAIVTKVLKIEPAVVERLVAKCDYVLVLNDTTMHYLKEDVTNLTAGGRIKPPFDYKGYVYSDLLRKLDPSLVNYKLPQ